MLIKRDLNNQNYNSIRFMILYVLPVLIFFISILPAKSSDYIQDIKAVFIYNFTKYIDWDKGSENATFVIAVVGENDILDPLKQIAIKRFVDQKKIQIKSFRNVSEIDNCHILFIPNTYNNHLNEIVEKLDNKRTLIVSEIKDSLQSGVMINFLISQENIKFEINLKAMKKACLEPGSELLKLAVRIIE